MAEPLSRERGVLVIGAGTMGSGIAEVAAAAGHRVYLRDASDAAVQRGLALIRASLDKRVARGKLPQSGRDTILERVQPAPPGVPSGLGLVIEAIYEDLEAKVQALTAVEASLPADATAPAVAQAIAATAQSWGKSPVHCRSTPGFIVNRVARPFYAEALRLLQEQAGSPATVDAVLRECGGFRMGPCELMDLIGHDVNFAVTRSVYQGFFEDSRYRPSLLQQELVHAGWLGRKSGRGFFDYAEGVQQPAADEQSRGPIPRWCASKASSGLRAGSANCCASARASVWRKARASACCASTAWRWR